MAGIDRRNGLQGMKKSYHPMARATIQFAACVLAALTSTAATSAQFEEGRLERIQALKTPRLDGIVPTYYTPGYKQHARDLQGFVTGEMGFAQRRLAVQLPLSLAVLDKAQRSVAERQLPYPMPSVDGEPPVALMPADWSAAEGFFENESDIAASTRGIQAGTRWLNLEACPRSVSSRLQPEPSAWKSGDPAEARAIFPGVWRLGGLARDAAAEITSRGNKN